MPQRIPTPALAMPIHVREFWHINSISPIKEQGVEALWLGRDQDYATKQIETCRRRTAIGIGAPALAKSLRGTKPVASRTTQIAKRERGRIPNVIGSSRRSPTFGAPNPNDPALTGGGSTVTIPISTFIRVQKLQTKMRAKRGLTSPYLFADLSRRSSKYD